MAKQSDPKGVRDPSTHRTPEQTKKHSRTYQHKPEVLANRVKMGQARDKLKKEGVALQGKDVHHKRGYHNDRGNLAAVSVAKNRGHKV